MTAIIPARGGSKGLPGKNIKMLCGKPLIAYTIECALNARNIDRVIVSTDDERIADVSKQFGAEIPFLRPASLATDSSQAIDSYIYTIDRISKEEGTAIDEFAVLLPTTPLRMSEDVDGAIDLFRKKGADSVVSYTPEEHPIYWHRHINADMRFVDIFDDTLANRQELRTSYYPNGAVYVFRSEIIKSHRYYTDKSYAYIMPRNRSVDIDTMDDFLYVEFLIARGVSVQR